jgi:hypothetical protein
VRHTLELGNIQTFRAVSEVASVTIMPLGYSAKVVQADRFSSSLT